MASVRLFALICMAVAVAVPARAQAATLSGTTRR